MANCTMLFDPMALFCGLHPEGLSILLSIGSVDILTQRLTPTWYDANCRFASHTPFPNASGNGNWFLKSILVAEFWKIPVVSCMKLSLYSLIQPEITIWFIQQNAESNTQFNFLLLKFRARWFYLPLSVRVFLKIPRSHTIKHRKTNLSNQKIW